MTELFPLIESRAGQLAHTLSGGEQQMVAIARGLMARPRLLMIDEPFLGLAPRIVDQIAEVLTRINAEGVAILFIEQNVELYSTVMKVLGQKRGRPAAVKTVQTKLRLPEPVYEDLKKAAGESQQTMSQIVAASLVATLRAPRRKRAAVS